MASSRPVLLIIVLTGLLSSVTPHLTPIYAKNPGNPTYTAPELLRYNDLVKLGSEENIEPSLKTRLDELLHTPFVSNEFAGNPRMPVDFKSGKVVRVAQWNIERGLRLDDIKLALTSPNDYLEKVKQSNADHFQPDSDEYIQLKADLSTIRDADILVLNEVDLGVKRTGYRNVARELAEALHMDYVYGVEFLEIDPVNLGTETFEGVDDKIREQMKQKISVDPSKFSGLHGSAILSRFPILNATVRPFDFQGYDWYTKEKEKVSIAEKGRRTAADKIFLEKIQREIRRGGRMSIIADVAIPGLPDGKVTIVATHLENHAKPASRQRQLEELLGLISNIRNPVILAGDMNTSGADAAPTSIRRLIFNRLGSDEFWAGQLLDYFTPFGLGVALSTAKTWKNERDPTSKNIYLVGPNPEQALFKILQNYRFNDGGVFDFRGDSDLTINGTKGTLANSNQRAEKGFASTFEMDRHFGPIGAYKLDWVFVKPYLKANQDGKDNRLFAPQFPRTLEALNRSLPGRLSDHNPITVDLPLYDSTRQGVLVTTTNPNQP